MQKYIEPLDWLPIESDQVVSGADRQGIFAPLECNISYYNHLSAAVYVVGRDGVPFELPPSGQRQNCLIIQVQYRIAHGTKVDPNNVFHTHANGTAQNEALRRAIENLESNGRTGTTRTLTVTYTYSRERLVSNGGMIYVTDLDLVLSVHNHPLDTWKALHPYSTASTRFQLLEADVDVNTVDSFGYSLRIVSNDGSVGDKYINIAGKLYRIPSVKCQSLQDGIHLCSSGAITNATRLTYPETHHYTLDEGKEQLLIFDTPDEAASLGDTVKQRDQEINDLKHRQKILEQEHAQELATEKYKLEERKRELEREHMEREENFRQLEHERQLRSIRDKEYFESRSAIRKDSSELVKFMPTILTAVIGLATLLVKTSR